LKQDKKLGRFTSSLYIYYTKAMTALVEYGTRCLYQATNYCSVLIVWSASWLKFSFSEMLRRELCLWPFAKKLYHGWISTMTSSN